MAKNEQTGGTQSPDAGATPSVDDLQKARAQLDADAAALDRDRAQLERDKKALKAEREEFAAAKAEAEAAFSANDVQFVKMFKGGESTEVHPSAVRSHQAVGWVVFK